MGLWRETTCGYLSDHGFVRGGNEESLAQTMARALKSSVNELGVWSRKIEQDRCC
jgi:hypothetical protein